METRMIGKTKIEVSTFGMGCWQLGNTEDWGTAMSDAQGIDLVHSALDRGCNFFDTAPPYARGNSETVLGNALSGHRDKAVICSKFGYTHNYTADHSVDGLHKSLEGTLKRLNTDYLDILLVHSPADDFYKSDMPQFEALEKLKAQGVLKAYGISADTTEHLRLILDHTQSQVLEVPFSIFSQEVSAVFDKAQEKGVGIISKVPLDSGWLSGKYTRDTIFDGARGRWNEAQKAFRLNLLDELTAILGDENLLNTALQFSLSHPAIASTIPGTKNPAQLESNIEAVQNSMHPDLAARLKLFWDSKIKNSIYEW